jgi:hypothetical protein
MKTRVAVRWSGSLRLASEHPNNEEQIDRARLRLRRGCAGTDSEDAERRVPYCIDQGQR